LKSPSVSKILHCMSFFLWSLYGIGQTIIFLSCGFFLPSFFLSYGCPTEYGRPLYFCPVVSIFFLFFPRLISAVADWMSTILRHMMWPYCEFRMYSEMCCTPLTGNTGRKKSPSAHHRTTLSCYTFATETRIDNWKKTC